MRSRRSGLSAITREFYFGTLSEFLEVWYFRERVSNVNHSESRKQCCLASDWSKFVTLSRKYRTLSVDESKTLVCYSKYILSLIRYLQMPSTINRLIVKMRVVYPGGCAIPNRVVQISRHSITVRVKKIPSLPLPLKNLNRFMGPTAAYSLISEISTVIQRINGAALFNVASLDICFFVNMTNFSLWHGTQIQTQYFGKHISIS